MNFHREVINTTFLVSEMQSFIGNIGSPPRRSEELLFRNNTTTLRNFIVQKFSSNMRLQSLIFKHLKLVNRTSKKKWLNLVRRLNWSWNNRPKNWCVPISGRTQRVAIKRKRQFCSQSNCNFRISLLLSHTVHPIQTIQHLQSVPSKTVLIILIIIITIMKKKIFSFY